MNGKIDQNGVHSPSIHYFLFYYNVQWLDIHYFFHHTTVPFVPIQHIAQYTSTYTHSALRPAALASA